MASRARELPCSFLDHSNFLAVYICSDSQGEFDSKVLELLDQFMRKTFNLFISFIFFIYCFNKCCLDFYDEAFFLISYELSDGDINGLMVE